MSERKTTRLKRIFESPQTVLMPFGVMPMHAQMAQRAGFEAFEVSGGMSSHWRGVPDLGLLTLTQVVAQAKTVRTSGGEAASPLCRARLTAGLTTTQLALKLGVAPSTVSRWENGVRTPAPEMWPRLAAALRLDPTMRDAVLADNPVRRSDGVPLPGLGQLRRDRGLTQRTLRSARGTGSNAAIEWEHGRVRPSPSAR